MRNCSIITNSGAGSYSAKAMDDLCQALANGGVKAELFTCSTFSEMTAEATRLAALHDNRIIAAAGGDGTINAVFNGLAGKNATCAIIPMGTANVMAIELGILTATAAAGSIMAGETRPLTAGLIRNETRESRFFLMAGAGFDGQIVRGVTLKEKKLLGKGAYALSSLRTLIAWDSTDIQVKTENEEFRCNSLIITNSSRYGGSFCISKSANLFSPEFELLVFKGNSRLDAIRGLTDALAAKNLSSAFYRTTATKISINSNKPVQADGDDWGDSPLEIVAEPGYAEIII